MSSLISHGPFDLERDRQGNLFIMFSQEYTVELREIVDFLKLIQQDQAVWEELTGSLYQSSRGAT